MQLWTSKNYHKNDKIFRGCFLYYRNENQYAEENFDVYRDKKDQSLQYISESSIRVSTGEILNIHVEYVVNKEFIPTYVMIEKVMGKDHGKELYEFNTRKNYIGYTFSSSKNEDKITAEIQTAPKFHITTPTTASAMLFLRSKKFDTNGKNSFNVLISHNQWEYKEPPAFKAVILERASLTAEKINIEGQNVQSTQYRLYDESTDFKNIKEPPHIKIFMSPHGSIPYIVRGDDGTRVQIKYLNDLSDKE
jgi:hypothetical protein